MEQTPVSQLFDLKGKNAVVTGGAMGIGYGIAYRLAEAGANVAIFDASRESAENAAQALKEKGYRVSAQAGDVAQESDVQNVIRAVLQEFGAIDILVNNAGIFPNITLRQMNFEDLERVIHINLLGAILCTKYAAEEMIKQGKGGKIINVTSIDAVRPSMIGLAHYDASKHGLWGFTKNAALEYAPHKIWINAIAPGGINTPGTGSMHRTPEMQKIIDTFAEAIPMKRMGEPDDIGRAALFLASDLSSYMTGSQIVVDGGVLLT